MAFSVGSVVSKALLSSVETIELRSRFGPPQVWKVKDLIEQREGPPNPVISLLKPTIVLRGPGIGEQIIAPAGAVGREDWKFPTATVLTLLGVGALTVLIGAYRLGQRRG